MVRLFQPVNEDAESVDVCATMSNPPAITTYVEFSTAPIDATGLTLVLYIK